jgi:hypothetical protein
MQKRKSAQKSTKQKGESRKIFDPGLIMMIVFILILLALAWYADVKVIDSEDKCYDYCNQFNLTAVSYGGLYGSVCQCIAHTCYLVNEGATSYYECDFLT